MKAIRQHAHGGPESLRYEDAPRPSPGAGEVLVRVRAAGVIPTELLWQTSRATRSGTPRPLPLIPGHEFSGELAALGEGVTGVRAGEAVFIAQPRGAELEEIARRMDAGQVRPVAGAEFPLADAIRAYRTKPLRAKVVLRVDGDG
jgi:NADPH:quinone reductase-like Zn-dependent oxidoreductase